MENKKKGPLVISSISALVVAIAVIVYTWGMNAGVVMFLVIVSSMITFGIVGNLSGLINTGKELQKSEGILRSAEGTVNQYEHLVYR